MRDLEAEDQRINTTNEIVIEEAIHCVSEQIAVPEEDIVLFMYKGKGTYFLKGTNLHKNDLLKILSNYRF